MLPDITDRYRSLVHKMKTQWGGRADRGYKGRNFRNFTRPWPSSIGPKAKISRWMCYACAM